MPDKYLKQNGATLKEVPFLVTSAGAGDAGKAVALDGTGHLDVSVMPVGIGADTKPLMASENMTAGCYVNVWNDTGVFKIRKADGSVAGKHAHGFILTGVSLGANATVYFEGTNTQVTGQTPGDVFLSASTPGLGTATAPSASGNIVQSVGIAISATEVNFEKGCPIELA